MNNADKKCAFCSAYLFEEDDVVYCPECGAPHHRECYLKVGACALKDKHGTAEQYTPPKAQETKQEHQEQNTNFEQNAEQNEIPFAKININMPKIDPEINLDDTINGVSIRKLMSFIFINPIRYIKNFLKFSKGGRVSWNWLAFLFPAPWLFLRKQYKMGFFALVLSIASVVFALPLSYEMNDIYANSGNDPYNLVYNMMLSIDISSVPIYLCATLGTLLDAAIRILCGLFGDKFYYSHVFSKLEKLANQENFENSALELRRVGGVNLWAALGCMLVLEYAPVLIGSFIF